MTTSSPPILIVSRYRLREEIGRGGASVVYRAEHAQTGEAFAAKFLNVSLAASAKGRFEREARTSARIRSEHVVKIIDAGVAAEVDHRPYLVMELLNGVDLEGYCLSRGPLAPSEVVEIHAQVGCVLDQAHGSGIIHRDLKPANLFLHAREDGTPILKLLDFGISKWVQKDASWDSASATQTSTGVFFGTPMYMAPEQVCATPAPITGTTDVWSVGLMAVKLLTGELYWRATTLPELMAALCLQPLYAPSERWPWLPEAFDAWFFRSCARDPEARWASAGEQALALAEAFGSKLVPPSSRRGGAASGHGHSVSCRRLSLGSLPLREWPSPQVPNVETLPSHGSPRGVTDAAAVIAPAPSPSPSPPDARRSGLPAPRAPIIGRAKEIATARALLEQSDVSVLTLTGPSGSGKTRLALHLAATVLGGFVDGAVFVDLAPLRWPKLVAPAIAQALGFSGRDGRTVDEALVDFLRPKEMLVLLDNFEHLLPAADLVANIVSACPYVKVLVTSRTALGIGAEQQMEVPPLALPNPENLPVASALNDVPAVQLFVRRARAVRPDFAVTPANASAIAAICVRLDGLPLAIELAACRTRSLSPQAILLRLEQPLDFLTSGARDLPPRQQTMRRAIEWGYKLLEPCESALLWRFALFVGGCTSEAAERVGEGAVERAKMLTCVESLLDKSFLTRSEQADGEPRFRMLEVIREYALERLAESGEAEACRERFVRYFLDFARQADVALRGPAQAVWLDRLEWEHDNLRAALEWSLETGRTEIATDLAGALAWFWYLRGHYTEGRRWLARALAQHAEISASVRAKAEAGAGVLAFLQCDYAEATALLEASSAAFEALDDKRRLVSALQFLGSVAREQGDCERAIRLHEESLRHAERLGDVRECQRAKNNVGFAAWLQMDFDRTKRVCTESISAFRALGDAEGTAWSLLNLAIAAHYTGDSRGARVRSEECLGLSRAAGYAEGVAWSLNVLGLIAARAGDYDEATSVLAESLKIHRDLGDRWRMASVLEAQGAVQCACLRVEEGVWLLAKAAEFRRTIGAPLPLVEHADYERSLDMAKARMGSEAFDAAWAQGAAMDLDELTAPALSGRRDKTPGPTGHFTSSAAFSVRSDAFDSRLQCASIDEQ